MPQPTLDLPTPGPASGAPYWLDVQGEHFSENLLPLAGADTLIGQRADCDVIVDDPGVSRLHCMISASARGLRLLDLGSTNGTWVNGRRVDDIKIHTQDLIKIGSTYLMLVCAHPRPYLERISRWHRCPHTGSDKPTVVLRPGGRPGISPRSSFTPTIKKLAHQLLNQP